MLGDKSQPTRYELLSMVRKHSHLLGKTISDEDDVSDVEMDSRFWHDIIDLYFGRGRESRGRQDDDLVFFVSKKGSHVHGSTDIVETNSPYFVRRWAPKLDDLVGENSINIDWRRSFYLNLIAHTSFSVTVAICSHQVLQQYQTGKDRPLSPIYKVVKTVYASPSRINFHLDSTKAIETTPAYPDICFAVDDFDSTFDAVVLNDTDHCYCVLLNAHDEAAFPSELAEQVSSSDTSLKTDKSPRKMNSKITLFSGFVNYQMVREAFDEYLFLHLFLGLLVLLPTCHEIGVPVHFRLENCFARVTFVVITPNGCEIDCLPGSLLCSSH
ncbi:unnamed protein product [Fraxinus pennsylvanica]|uniref:Uncharacterized protein n=1 Tax=Fraxinus pennsylvanica TaxID=56036 RepID=A0AAD2A1I6_9LAMI|nr:unnamed protein product [Fraxinus pennsylvanica]